MSLAAKWKNRASGGACGGEVVSSIFPISSKYPIKPNSGDCGNIEHKNPTPVLSTAGGPSGLPWPEPEPGPVDTATPAGRYACLYAIASHFGAGLTKDAGGGLTLTCPATMPQDAAQAARDGLTELADYIGERQTGIGYGLEKR